VLKTQTDYWIWYH